MIENLKLILLQYTFVFAACLVLNVRQFSTLISFIINSLFMFFE
jgi:DNA phosphorothioation-dependent restriction protein DptG